MDFRSEMVATTKLLQEGETTEAIDRLQRLFDAALQNGNALWVALLARHLSIILEHERMNERAVEALRAAIAVVPGDPTLHYALARFEVGDTGRERLELALRLLSGGPDDWKVPYLRETMERQIQLRK